MRTFADPWPLASPRFLDIDDNAFSSAYRSGFRYAGKSVSLTWETRPAGKVFRGRLRATGLKPNFAYQLKLIGKPVKGPRGWGAQGDDAANEAIGRAGRWWNDTTQANALDAEYSARYKNQTPGAADTVYGYLFMGVLVTDASGNLDAPFVGDKSYHITWQDKQDYGLRQVEAGSFPVGGGTAYAPALATYPVKLWYEWEFGRSRRVQLPAGSYNCRFLLTEESFHNNFGGVYASSPIGGFYQSVLVNEDYSGGSPDTNPANDIRFEIG